MSKPRDRGADPMLKAELSLVCQHYPSIVARGTQTLLIKTYLKWLADPKNPYLDLVDFTSKWVNQEKWRRS
jgi:hypothetical protein